MSRLVRYLVLVISVGLVGLSAYILAAFDWRRSPAQCDIALIVGLTALVVIWLYLGSQEQPRLTIRIRKAGQGFDTYCPELQVSGCGPTRELALKDVKKAARIRAHAIVSIGVTADTRWSAAKHLLEHVNDDEAFEVVDQGTSAPPAT